MKAMKRNKLITRKRVGKRSKIVGNDSDILEFENVVPSTNIEGNKSPLVSEETLVTSIDVAHDFSLESKCSKNLRHFSNEKSSKHFLKPNSTGGHCSNKCQKVELSKNGVKVNADENFQIALALSESLKVEEENNLRTDYSAFNIGCGENIRQGAFQIQSESINSKCYRLRNFTDVAPSLLTCSQSEREKIIGDKVASILTDQHIFISPVSNIFQKFPSSYNLESWIEGSPLWSLSHYKLKEPETYLTPGFLRKLNENIPGLPETNMLTTSQRVFMDLANMSMTPVSSSFKDSPSKWNDSGGLLKDEQNLFIESHAEAGLNATGRNQTIDELTSLHKERLFSFFNKHDHGDILIKCSDGEVFAHSHILTIHLPSNSVSRNTVDWTQFEISTVIEFLYFLYCGSIREALKDNEMTKINLLHDFAISNSNPCIKNADSSPSKLDVEHSSPDLFENFVHHEQFMPHSSSSPNFRTALKTSECDPFKNKLLVSDSSVELLEQAVELNTNSEDTSQIFLDDSDKWANLPRDDYYCPSDDSTNDVMQTNDSTFLEKSTLILENSPSYPHTDNRINVTGYPCYNDLKADQLPWSKSINESIVIQHCATPLNETKLDDILSPSSSQSSSNVTLPVKEYITCEKVTPKPDFLKMVTPEVQTRLKQYGIRNLSKKKAATMLNFIYDQLHPYVEEKHSSPNKSDRSSHSSGMSDSLEMLEESLMMTQSSFNEGLHTSTKLYLESNQKLYESILQYETVTIEKLSSDMKHNGIRHKMNDLVQLLDQECITYKMPERKRKQ